MMPTRRTRWAVCALAGRANVAEAISAMTSRRLMSTSRASGPALDPVKHERVRYATPLRRPHFPFRLLPLPALGLRPRRALGPVT